MSSSETESTQSSSSYDSESESNVSVSSDELYDQADNIELSGCIINKYNIISEIGRGADAIVWLGYNIEDNKYYAIKINEPREYKKGLDEFKFLKNLPEKMEVFNHLKFNFIEQKNSKKYACGVFEVQTGNIDSLLRKSNIDDGLPVKIVRKIMYQLLTAIKYLHTKLKVYHADIKTDNILLKGLNEFDKKIIDQYNSLNFFDKYQEAKKQFWLGKGKSIETISNIKQEDKRKIREVVHKHICEQLEIPDKSHKYKVNQELIEKCNVTLSDFGAYCSEDEHYESEFGTRYYRAPEVILMGESSYPVDIWACGCVFYELLTGRLLFDPDKDSKHSRDEYHLHDISRLCGEFNIGFLKKTKYWRKYFNDKGKMLRMDPPKKDIRDMLIKYKVTEDLDNICDLLKGMLEISTKQRFDIEKCLKHPFFGT